MHRRHLRLLLLAGLAVVASAAAGCGREAASSPEPPASGPSEATAPVDPWQPPAEVERPALRYARFETLGRADGLPSDKTTCVLAEGDDLVVGTDAGLALRTSGTWRVLREADGLKHPYVTSVARQATTGDLWIATLGGLHRLSADRLDVFTQLDSGLMNDVVYHVITEGDLVWAATAAGTSVLDTRTGAWGVWNQENSIMHEPWCYALARAPGRLFVAVWGGGVVEREDATGLWREYRDPDGEMELDLLKDDGPIHDVSSFVAFDAGVLWQGTYFGLSRYDGRRWTTYTAADDGLPGDFVNHVASRGRTAWVSTDQGFAVTDGETLVSYRAGAEGGCEVRTWVKGGLQGTAHLETAPPSDYVLWAQGRHDDVWLATGEGLCHGVAAAEGGPR